jgi:hypothetical protein
MSDLTDALFFLSHALRSDLVCETDPTTPRRRRPHWARRCTSADSPPNDTYDIYSVRNAERGAWYCSGLCCSPPLPSAPNRSVSAIARKAYKVRGGPAVLPSFQSCAPGLPSAHHPLHQQVVRHPSASCLGLVDEYGSMRLSCSARRRVRHRRCRRRYRNPRTPMVARSHPRPSSPHFPEPTSPTHRCTLCSRTVPVRFSHTIWAGRWARQRGP